MLTDSPLVSLSRVHLGVLFHRPLVRALWTRNNSLLSRELDVSCAFVKVAYIEHSLLMDWLIATRKVSGRARLQISFQLLEY